MACWEIVTFMVGVFCFYLEGHLSKLLTLQQRAFTVQDWLVCIATTNSTSLQKAAFVVIQSNKNLIKPAKALENSFCPNFNKNSQLLIETRYVSETFIWLSNPK